VSGRTVVVLRALGLGDYLTGLPALRAIRRAFPEHRVVLLAPEWLRPLVDATAPVDELRSHPGLVAVPADLHHADVAVDLHGRGPLSQPLLADAAPRRLVCFAHPELAFTGGGARWEADEHEVLRWCRMLEHAAIPSAPHDLYFEPPPPELVPGLLGATVLHPGASSAARRWPPDRFVEVGRHLHEAGHALVVSGGSGERPLVDRIVGELGVPVRRFVGRTTLELAALVGHARLVVAGDTGVAHLATATRVPSVVLFGPVSPRHWGPPEDAGSHAALWAGRTGDPHGTVVDPGLLDIGPAEVIQAIDRISVAPKRRAEPALVGPAGPGVGGG
jgi:ADP-heptose:LPS heptosyltransferase